MEYKNGLATRRLILEASRALFLGKGFHETSSEDICRAAHVNRSAIHYHFGDRESIRYRVLWAITEENRGAARGRGGRPEVEMACALYLGWCQVLADPAYRKFHLDYSRDYPVYLPERSLPRYYRTVCREVFGGLWPVEEVSPLVFASMYGHLMGLMQLACVRPEQFTGRDLFFHGMDTCVTMWGIPRPVLEPFRRELEAAVDALDGRG